MGKSGLHNVLEPAVFGIPVLIGKNYQKFNEAKELVDRGGVISVGKRQQFEDVMSLLVSSVEKRVQIGEINTQFIAESKGATSTFVKFYEKENK